MMNLAIVWNSSILNSFDHVVQLKWFTSNEDQIANNVWLNVTLFVDYESSVIAPLFMYRKHYGMCSYNELKATF